MSDNPEIERLTELCAEFYKNHRNDAGIDLDKLFRIVIAYAMRAPNVNRLHLDHALVMFRIQGGDLNDPDLQEIKRLTLEIVENNNRALSTETEDRRFEKGIASVVDAFKGVIDHMMVKKDSNFSGPRTVTRSTESLDEIDERCGLNVMTVIPDEENGYWIIEPPLYHLTDKVGLSISTKMTIPEVQEIVDHTIYRYLAKKKGINSIPKAILECVDLSNPIVTITENTEDQIQALKDRGTPYLLFETTNRLLIIKPRIVFLHQDKLLKEVNAIISTNDQDPVPQLTQAVENILETLIIERMMYLEYKQDKLTVD